MIKHCVIYPQVYVSITGVMNFLDKTRLCHGSGNKKMCFCRGSRETFYVKAPTLGDLQYLTIEVSIERGISQIKFILCSFLNFFSISPINKLFITDLMFLSMYDWVIANGILSIAVLIIEKKA